MIQGDSGTGKTTFCTELLRRVNRTGSDCLLLYLNLLNDEFLTANIFESLICLCWNSYRSNQDRDLLRVPDGFSFYEFAKRKQLTDTALRNLYRAVKQSAGLIPGFKDAISVLPETVSVGSPPTAGEADVAASFAEYISAVSREHEVFIALDNYQFLSAGTRMVLESRLGLNPRGVRLITIERTIAGTSELEQFLCFPEHRYHLNLKNFDFIQTESFLTSALASPADSAPVISRDCFFKTQGNPKLIDLYVRALQRTDRLESEPLPPALVDTIDSLPRLARSVILLTSIFTGGLKRRYVETTLRALVAPNDQATSQDVLNELVSLGYIVINGSTNEMVRVAHETVLSAMSGSQTDEEIGEIRDLALRTFDRAISSGLGDEEYFYVLHCLVGILHLHEALTRLDKVTTLIDHQHRQAKFEYVALIYKTNPKLIGALPPLSVRFILDSLQKTCQFALGVSAVQELIKSGFEDRELLNLFNAKYQVQTYHPNEALDALESLPRSPTNLMIKLNALLCLDLIDEARAVVSELRKFPRAEELYIGLRNTAHLYRYDVARSHLLEAYNFFNRIGRRFVTGTIMNNLGIVYLCGREWEEAARALTEAEECMLSLGSVEVFESRINLCVRAALLGNYGAATAYLDGAEAYVPRELTLDKIMIATNREVVAYLAGTVLLEQACERFKALYYESLTIDDPRLHDILAYNWHALAQELGLDSVAPRHEFLEVLSSDLVGTEIRVETQVGKQQKDLCFILSPHWRY